MMKNVELLKKFFTKDKYVALSGITIDEVDEDSAVVSVQLGEKHCNANGFAQGGLIYTLADFAFAVLSNYKHPATVTQCGNISYLRPATGEKLTATAREVERAGHHNVCEVLIKNDSGKTVAIAQFNGFIKEMEEEELWKEISK